MRLALFILLVFGNVSFGQDNLIPGNYRSVKEIFGDLDKDGVTERVVVYNMDTVFKTEGVDREIIIFKKEKSINTGFRITGLN